MTTNINHCKPQHNITRKYGFLLVLLLSTITCFAQYDYPLTARTLKEMNIKGKVKKMTETQEMFDSHGKPQTDKLKVIYEFDENGNITKAEQYDMSLNKLAATALFKYKDGRLIEITVKTDNVTTEKLLFSYSQNKTTLKDEKGNVVEVNFLKDGRIIKTKEFDSTGTNEEATSNYEYNDQGWVDKKTVYITGEDIPNISFYTYNTNGLITSKKEYSYRSPMPDVTSFVYILDGNSNWTKCDEKEKNGAGNIAISFSRTRTYEYY